MLIAYLAANTTLFVFVVVDIVVEIKPNAERREE